MIEATRCRTFELRGEGFMRAQSDEPGGDFGLTANLPLDEGKLALRASLGAFRDHGAMIERAPTLSRKLSRVMVLELPASRPPCLVVLETCGATGSFKPIHPSGHS